MAIKTICNNIFLVAKYLHSNLRNLHLCVWERVWVQNIIMLLSFTTATQLQRTCPLYVLLVPRWTVGRCPHSSHVLPTWVTAPAGTEWTDLQLKPREIQLKVFIFQLVCVSENVTASDGVALLFSVKFVATFHINDCNDFSSSKKRSLLLFRVLLWTFPFLLTCEAIMQKLTLGPWAFEHIHASITYEEVLQESKLRAILCHCFRFYSLFLITTFLII